MKDDKRWRQSAGRENDKKQNKIKNKYVYKTNINPKNAIEIGNFVARCNRACIE